MPFRNSLKPMWSDQHIDSPTKNPLKTNSVFTSNALNQISRKNL